jgi:hypothetical protein
MNPFALCLFSTVGLCSSVFAADAAVSPAEVPPALRVPAGQSAFLKAFAKGVQIYECAPKADQPSAFEWKLTGPEATLADAAGKPLGKHYAGPTWESTDGSSVVGEVRARDPGPDPKAIPWLLLSAKSTSGKGILGAATSIQRVDTVGGIAPAEHCDTGSAHKVARIAYSATYYFYRASP